MTGLKHCPFCGGKPQRITITDESEAANIGGDVITCADCDASTRVFFGEKEGIEEAWNTRLPLQPDADERKAMVMVITEALYRHGDKGWTPSGSVNDIADALIAAGWTRKREDKT